jgi:hypothetical protein
VRPESQVVISSSFQYNKLFIAILP